MNVFALGSRFAALNATRLTHQCPSGSPAFVRLLSRRHPRQASLFESRVLPVSVGRKPQLRLVSPPHPSPALPVHFPNPSSSSSSPQTAHRCHHAPFAPLTLRSILFLALVCIHQFAPKHRVIVGQVTTSCFPFLPVVTHGHAVATSITTSAGLGSHHRHCPVLQRLPSRYPLNPRLQIRCRCLILNQTVLIILNQTALIILNQTALIPNQTHSVPSVATRDALGSTGLFLAAAAYCGSKFYTPPFNHHVTLLFKVVTTVAM
jgi:hypothetical protein